MLMPYSKTYNTLVTSTCTNIYSHNSASANLLSSNDNDGDSKISHKDISMEIFEEAANTNLIHSFIPYINPLKTTTVSALLARKKTGLNVENMLIYKGQKSKLAIENTRKVRN